VVENFDELESWIEMQEPCLLQQLYETRSFQEYNWRASCKDTFDVRINEYLMKSGLKSKINVTTLV